ncbi:MAG: bifunctional adenosylcobinamide kinase/adenosylcobinamide-phosphate guanylyltransferase, partial [Actinomycetes bacterium]
DGTSVGPGAARGHPPVQPRRTLVLGGARSGKSVEAERMLAGEPAVTYVATARPLDDDPEWAERVAMHRRRRPTTWRTVETRDVAAVIRNAETPVLVDCLTLWLADAMEAGDHSARVDELVSAWRDARTRVVAVTNEVGSGVVPGTPQGRAFRDELGRLNARVAAESEAALLVVAGRVVPL